MKFCLMWAPNRENNLFHLYKWLVNCCICLNRFFNVVVILNFCKLSSGQKHAQKMHFNHIYAQQYCIDSVGITGSPTLDIYCSVYTVIYCPGLLLWIQSWLYFNELMQRHNINFSTRFVLLMGWSDWWVKPSPAHRFSLGLRMRMPVVQSVL